ncbi:NUDIX domain-containing protein [Erythrobacter sp. SDW2]|uniref:NUDIX domain-containing protein n=1 Tax=Erythrobacter sp. SDW2 TaxID=2907154 RepID=UPI001F30A5E1|nr:NUDIX domain-containing protein [Erythrobacter sp. SDW2]UIP05990.1 NUDIX domain-containing protein [Erythrobacter sp. SDW2]
MTKKFTPLIVVAAAVSDGSGRWLMHKRPAHKQHGGLWEFPGGKVEADECPGTALAREIEEEAGIRLDPDELAETGFAVSCGDESADGIVILLYTAERWHGDLEAREGGQFQWFDHAGIATLDKPPLDVVLARQLAQKRP